MALQLVAKTVFEYASSQEIASSYVACATTLFVILKPRPLFVESSKAVKIRNIYCACSIHNNNHQRPCVHVTLTP